MQSNRYCTTDWIASPVQTLSQKKLLTKLPWSNELLMRY